jgi:putative Mn2+ efflux pump MntP
MGTWLAIAGIGVATDNLLLASGAGSFARSHTKKKWLRAAGLVLIIQLQGLILGWLVGGTMDGWFGSVAHWVAIGFILGMGLRILFEATSSGRLHGQFVLTTQNILDAALGTAIYTFVYGQCANMLHATLPRSIELMSAATMICIVGGLLLAERYRTVWLVRLAGGLIVCASAAFLFMREL